MNLIYQVPILFQEFCSYFGSSQKVQNPSAFVEHRLFFPLWFMTELFIFNWRIIIIFLWVLPYIVMNRPQVQVYPLPLEPPLPPPSLPHSCRLSQSTGFGFPVSYIKLPLAICFIYGNVYVSTLFSQISHPRLFPLYPKVCSLCLCLLCCLHVGSSVPSFYIPYTCVNIRDLSLSF